MKITDLNLIDEAYLDGALTFFGYETYYTQYATCKTTGKEYKLRYNILANYNPSIEDESNACDWNNPSAIEKVWD